MRDSLSVLAYTVSYIHHGIVAHANKFLTCQFELLVSGGNDEEQTALKWTGVPTQSQP